MLNQENAPTRQAVETVRNDEPDLSAETFAGGRTQPPPAPSEDSGIKAWFHLIEEHGSTRLSPLSTTRIGAVEDSSVGRIQFGVTTLGPTDKVPDVLVLADVDADRPLGAGIHSDGAYVAFKNMWDFVPGSGLKLQKTVVVGTADELESFSRTMRDEMLNSRAAAFRMGAKTVDDLSVYFELVELDQSGRAAVERKNGRVEIQRVENPMDDRPGLGFIVRDLGATDGTQAARETAIEVGFNSTFEESVAAAAAMAAERRSSGKLYHGPDNEPSLQIIGSANLLAPEDNSCKVFHDGHGHSVAIDFGVSFPRFIEKGGDPDALTHVLLTHPHADHLIGLPDLLAYRESRLSDGLDRLTLVTNSYTAETLFKQIEAVFGEKKADDIRRSLDVVILEEIDDTGYRPIRLDDMRIEAVNVRHSVEDAAGRSVTLGFKISTTYTEDGTEKTAAYADSGDTQIGSRYLRHEKAALTSFLDRPEIGSEAPPAAGDPFYAEAKAAIALLEGYASANDKQTFRALSAAADRGFTREELALLVVETAATIGEMNGAILANNRMDLRLFEMMRRASEDVRQVNYVDVGGAAGMLSASDLVMQDGTRITGKAGIVHASVADSAYLFARLSDPGAVWLAGHCKSDVAAGSYITAKPGSGSECQIVEITSGCVKRHDASM